MLLLVPGGGRARAMGCELVSWWSSSYGWSEGLSYARDGERWDAGIGRRGEEEGRCLLGNLFNNSLRINLCLHRNREHQFGRHVSIFCYCCLVVLKELLVVDCLKELLVVNCYAVCHHHFFSPLLPLTPLPHPAQPVAAPSGASGNLEAIETKESNVDVSIQKNRARGPAGKRPPTRRARPK